jgi:hypothetical protein
MLLQEFLFRFSGEIPEEPAEDEDKRIGNNKFTTLHVVRDGNITLTDRLFLRRTTGN